MISKNKVKFIVSLQKKKVREEENLFVIEGDKLVREFIDARVPVRMLIAKPEFLRSVSTDISLVADEIIEASFEELKQISSLKTAHNALAVIRIAKPEMVTDNILKGLSVALDFVQDPGNLGTIIRSASWFGIKNIVCSENCVDLYNPKVVQATMGAILHVNIFYSDLKRLFSKAKENKVPVFGAMLEGGSVYDQSLSKKGIILLGNESKGISDELVPYITDRIMIPGANISMPGIESLNVGMAASVIFSEFFRRTNN